MRVTQIQRLYTHPARPCLLHLPDPFPLAPPRSACPVHPPPAPPLPTTYFPPSPAQILRTSFSSSKRNSTGGGNENFYEPHSDGLRTHADVPGEETSNRNSLSRFRDKHTQTKGGGGEKGHQSLLLESAAVRRFDRITHAQVCNPHQREEELVDGRGVVRLEAEPDVPRGEGVSSPRRSGALPPPAAPPPRRRLRVPQRHQVRHALPPVGGHS